LPSADGIGVSQRWRSRTSLLLHDHVILFHSLQNFDRIGLAEALGWLGRRPPHEMDWNLARPRAFDDDKVLDAAINCFWQRGLGATSVRDLTAEMGINGPSLYNAFGDKHAVFARALERYAERSMRSTIRRLESGLAPRNAVAEFLRLLIEKSVTDPDRRGCLIVNSALEVSPHDTELAPVIASYLDEIEAFFWRCLRRGQASGEINKNINARDAARLLLGVVLGLRVAARSRPERALLEGMVRPALALLDPPVRLRLKEKS
jgi:TetR/AcrR family transcriptional regulator, transcriptional repressor for nem operon